MDRTEELRQWFDFAKQNLGIAKFLAEKYHPTPVEAICNNCQQSAEKDLKGYLFNKNINFPFTHDLSELLAMCIEVDTGFLKFTRQCTFLTRYGVAPKYPNDLQITGDDAKIAIRFADEIKEFVLSTVKSVTS
jgi:HEPN domain-containing protein